MKCPFCGQEMEQGKLRSRGGLFFLPEGEGCRRAGNLQVDFAFREDHSAAADLDLTSGGGAAFTAVRAAVSVQMGENQGRATHFFALDDLTVIAVFDEAVEIAVVGQRSFSRGRARHRHRPSCRA